ncbi:MAG: Maf family protein [Acidobacteriota bacterium]|nr:Maf family protein [Acidobacteriota bacterium]
MNTESPLNERLVLASKSPRRAEILRAVGWEFQVMAADIDETRIASEDAVSYVKRLAQTKAETVARKIQAGTVLGADTVVVIAGAILGQPRDDEDARRMLKLLNGNWHEVLTGVALACAGQTFPTSVDYETTRVRFAEMSDEEIDGYVSTGESRGKAGAYGIQGRAALFIEEIQGDYFNVVGLPIRLVYEMSRKLPEV